MKKETKKVVKKTEPKVGLAITDITYDPFWDEVKGCEMYVKKSYKGTKLVSEEIVNEIR
jgi:hypothetical protein